MIHVDGLTKSYGGTAVLDDIRLSLPAGGVTAILGPNGAGKSTLLSIMGRMIRADAGRVTVGGMDLSTERGARVARRLAVLRQDNHAAARLSVRELVAFGRYPIRAVGPPPTMRPMWTAR